MENNNQIVPANNNVIVPVRSEEEQQGLNIVTLGLVVPYLCFAQLCDLFKEFLCNRPVLESIFSAMRTVNHVVLPCKHLTKGGLEHVFGGDRYRNKKTRFEVEQNTHFGYDPNISDYSGLNIYHLDYYFYHDNFSVFNYSLLEVIELFCYPKPDVI